MKRALVLLLLVAACGGSSGGNGASGKASYITKAEAICASANADLAKAKKETPTAVAAVPAYAHRLVDIASKNVSALSALTPPSDDATQIKAKMLDPLAQQVSEGNAYVAQIDAAAHANDSAKLTQLVFNPPTKTRVDLPWMKSYGFKECVTAADTGAATK
jgi:hypothetical protein